MLLHGNGTNGAQNNTFVDSSTNNFTITRNGNTTQGTFSPYGSNWSNFFDGTGDYLSLADNAALQWSTGDFCVEAWIYPSSVSGSKAIVCKGTNNTGTFDLGLYGAKIELYTNALVFSSSASLSANTWTHVAVTRSGTTLRCFINGALDTTVTSSYNFNNAGTFYVGVYGSGSVNYFNGYMSNVRCVKGSAVYTSAFTPSTTPLTAITNTSLLTCADNRFIDDSTNNFTITKNGDVSVQRFSPFAPTSAYSTSVIGGSGYFDGTGDRLSSPANTAIDLSTADFTAECWVYPTSFSSTKAIFVYQNADASNTNYGYWLTVKTTGVVRFENFSGSSQVGFDSTVAMNLNTWNHIAVTRTGTSATTYVNGVGTSGTVSATFNAPSGAILNIGDNFGATFGSSNPYSGYLSNLRIVKGTRVYTANFTPPTAPLTAITNTSLLLNFTNAGILDNAMMNDLETVGNAQISTSVKKYGTGSMYFDATADRLVAASSPNIAFGTGDFTVEFWLNSNNVASANQRGVIQTSDTSGGLKAGYTTGIAIYQGGNATGGALNGGITANVAGTFLGSSSAVITTSTWYHIALVRSSGTSTIYVNGTSVGSATTTGNCSGQFVCVGGYYDTTYLYDGYLDDLRITKGFARYTSNFTAPTAAFPDKG
jgi:hypothetical protein